MPRPMTKNDLMATAKENYEKLNEFISKMTEEELNTPFDFSKDEKKKEAHWKRDKNLRDVLIHLYEWHQLVLNWVHSNQKGEEKPFLPYPYNWKTYGDMNVEFWKNIKRLLLKKQLKCFINPIAMFYSWLKPLQTKNSFQKVYINGLEEVHLVLIL